MQGFRYSLCPLGFFRGVIEEESLFAEIKLLKTKKKKTIKFLSKCDHMEKQKKKSIPRDRSTISLKDGRFPAGLIWHMLNG